MDSKLTIVTINYNNANGLATTIESVVSQTYKAFEYIVIDGGSTDGSKDVIEKYASKIDYWVSEQDEGIYHAMNKGIRQAKGEYLLFLNSGDHLIEKDILQQVVTELDGNTSFIACDIRIQKDNQCIIKRHPDDISFEYIYTYSLAHQSIFIHRSIFTKYGYYNEDNKIISDWEIFFRAIALNGDSYKRVPIILSNYDGNGISSNIQELSREKEKVTRKYLHKLIKDEEDMYLLKSIWHPNKRINYLIKIEQSFILSIFLNKLLGLLLWLTKNPYFHKIEQLLLSHIKKVYNK